MVIEFNNSLFNQRVVLNSEDRVKMKFYYVENACDLYDKFHFFKYTGENQIE